MEFSFGRAAIALAAMTMGLLAQSPQAVLPDPAWAAHDLDVGEFYYNRGDYAGALARFQDAVRMDPRTTEALYREGLTEIKLKQPAAARQALEAYLTADPNGKYIRQARSELARLFAGSR